MRCTELPARHLFTSRDLMLREDAREWDAVAASLEVPAARLLLIRQVHGRDIAIARRGTTGWLRPVADAIISDDPDVAIGVRVADCAPVLLFDPARRVGAAVHAGWRGTAAAISRITAMTLQTEFGSRPSDVIAAVGPCLGRCCGEVGPDVLAAFRAHGTREQVLNRWFAPGEGDRLFLDLERANREQLESAGIDPARIFVSGLCTKTHRGRLHSYRGHGPAAGRLLGAIRAHD
jgi:YfiH family protein